MISVLVLWDLPFGEDFSLNILQASVAEGRSWKVRDAGYDKE